MSSVPSSGASASKIAEVVNFAVEEENFATIPFAILERRVGRSEKIEVRGQKIALDGTQTDVVWQVQGSSDHGLPTEHDLDIFIAIGVLTFRNNFQKTVVFTGAEIARILGISYQHGRFYQRLKLAMERFVPLRFRAVAENENQEQIKWRNVFQEASFSLDKKTGRCIGTITWTDKLIDSMDGGFFRLLDANRYMQLDGITPKHLYRFIAVQFEKLDTVLIDARRLAQDHLGILTPPKYFSRLMQTLEPAFEQLRAIRVLGSWHIVSTKEWRLALTRHPDYIPERKMLFNTAPAHDPVAHRAYCQTLLQEAGMSASHSTLYVEKASTAAEFYLLERASRVLQSMQAEEVALHVALSFAKKSLDCECINQMRSQLDIQELAVEVCRQKKVSRQSLNNPAGLIVKLIKDKEARDKLVHKDVQISLLEKYSRREQNVIGKWKDDEERDRILEYETFRDQVARRIYDEMPDATRSALKQEKRTSLGLGRGSAAGQLEHLVDLEILQEIGKQEVPSYERWLMRQRAQQSIFELLGGSRTSG